MNEIEIIRDNNLIDPAMHIWGWEIPVYLFLGGLTAGIMILTPLLWGRTKPEERTRWARWLPFAAPVLISLGMGALFLDLAYKAHVYRFYLAFRPASPMSWGSWILLGIYPATLLMGLLGLSDDEADKLSAWGLLRATGMGKLLTWARGVAQSWERVLLAANVALGVALGGYTGLLLGTLGARPAWSSTVLGPLFLISGISTGAAFMMLFPLSHKEHGSLRRWDIGAIVAELSLIGVFLLGLLTGGDTGRQAASLFLGGEYTALFWALVVMAGLAVPLGLELVEGAKKLAATRLAPVLLLAGGLSLRWILVVAGQA